MRIERKGYAMRCSDRRVHAQATVGMALVVFLIAASPAAAVTDIRYERWSFFPAGASISAHVYFDATSTSLDLTHGFRFAIAERDPGANEILVRFEVQPCAAFPIPGTDIAVFASFSLYCSPSGELRAGDQVSWEVSWCEYPQQQTCAEVNRPALELPSLSQPEDFELVVLDETDSEGSFPTPEDVLHCGPSGLVSVLPEFVAPEYARGGTIGVYADAAGTVCSDHIQVSVPFRWYVVAHLEGMARCGVSTVEFGIHDLPAGLVIQPTPNPHALGYFGNLFSTGGLFFTCERGSDDTVVLFTLDGATTVPLQETILRLEGGRPPSNRFWPYPWADLCPSARRHMDGQQFVINPSPANDCELPVPVWAHSWGHLKSLYRTPR